MWDLCEITRRTLLSRAWQLHEFDVSNGKMCDSLALQNCSLNKVQATIMHGLAKPGNASIHCCFNIFKSHLSFPLENASCPQQVFSLPVNDLRFPLSKFQCLKQSA